MAAERLLAKFPSGQEQQKQNHFEYKKYIYRYK